MTMQVYVSQKPLLFVYPGCIFLSEDSFVSQLTETELTLNLVHQTIYCFLCLIVMHFVCFTVCI